MPSVFCPINISCRLRTYPPFLLHPLFLGTIVIWSVKLLVATNGGSVLLDILVGDLNLYSILKWPTVFPTAPRGPRFCDMVASLYISFQLPLQYSTWPT